MARLPASIRRAATVAVILGVAGVAAWIVFARRPVSVETGLVSRGPLAVAVADEGRTRVRDRHVVAAPVGGRMQRLDAQAGDAVTAGAVLARIVGHEPPLRDARAQAEAVARVGAARADVARLDAELERARSAQALAHQELERARALEAGGIVARSSLDEAEAAWQSARAATRSASFAAHVGGHELEVARLVLRHADGVAEPSAIVEVTSPVDGRVLRVLRESEGPVEQGEALVEVGDPEALEVVVDLVTSDAVNVREGAQATLSAWGRPTALSARVRRVEPSATTKVSALGIEEQRVDVILDIDVTGADAGAARLGDGFALEARIVTWESQDAVSAPLGALFRKGRDWAAFVVRDGRAHLVDVVPGHWAEDAVEITSGLAPGDVVVVHPPEALRDGDRVQVQDSAS